MTAAIQSRIERYSIPEPNSGCWLWLGSIDGEGYGRATFRGKSDGAHRVSYTAFREAIPAGLLVCHSCDVRCCVNPDHLWVGTYADNNRDMLAKGRHGNGVRTGGQVIGATRIRSTGKWQAQRNGKYLGTFADLADAQAAYRAAA